MALIQAVKQGHVRGIKLLISNGDTLSLKSNVLGTTALIEACKFEEKQTAKKMIKVLLKNGACVNDRDYLGRNALHWVCLNGNTELTNTLLSSHAPTERIDFAMTDFEGNSILHFAVKTGKCSFIRHVCKLYKKYHVTEWGRNKDGLSAADMAVECGHKNCAMMVQDVTNFDDSSGSLSSASGGDKGEVEDRVPALPSTFQRHRKGKNYLELPLLETGRLQITNKYDTRKNTHRSKDGIDKHRSETSIVPLSSTDRKLSEEIIGKISYRNLLADMNWIQSIEHSGSYRQGVDESQRLQQLEQAARRVTHVGVSKADVTKSKQKHKRSQKEVPHFKMNKKNTREEGNDLKKKDEVGKSRTKKNS